MYLSSAYYGNLWPHDQDHLAMTWQFGGLTTVTTDHIINNYGYTDLKNCNSSDPTCFEYQYNHYSIIHNVFVIVASTKLPEPVLIQH